MEVWHLTSAITLHLKEVLHYGFDYLTHKRRFAFVTTFLVWFNILASKWSTEFFHQKEVNDWAHSGFYIYVIVVRLTIHKRKSKGILESLQFPLRKRKLVVSRAEF